MPTPVHLVILIHGLYGSPTNLAVVHEELLEAGESKVSLSESQSQVDIDSGSEFEVETHLNNDEQSGRPGGPGGRGQSRGHGLEVVGYLVNSFTGSMTWDGIDVNAYRASKEVDAEIERLEAQGKEVVAFSVVS